MYKIIISSLAIVLIFSLTIAASDTKNTDKENIGKPFKTKTQETQSTDNPQPSVPKMINYQGKLTDTLGNPQNDTFDMTFRIYDAAIGGTEYWYETQTDVIVTDGLFNVMLGSINSIDLATEFPFGPDCYLEIIVGTQTITPRQRIVSHAYTFFADEADNAANLDGVPASSYVVRPIQSEDIADSAVTMPKINQSGATTGQVIKWTGSAWSPQADNTGGNPSGPAGGDLTGTYPNPLIANSAVTMPKINQSGATTGQVIKWTGSAWAPQDDEGAGGPFLALTGGTMTGPITNTGKPAITMGKGNFGSGNSNSGTWAFVAGENNSASGLWSTVGGGYGDTASGQYATVGGGFLNTASGLMATIGGGESNTTKAQYGGVLSGQFNLAGDDSDDTAAVVAGGVNNSAAGAFSFVGGGKGNIATAPTATLIPNRAAAVVAGGENNSATDAYSFVGGGLNNNASNWFSNIAGGCYNIASGEIATVGGGLNNTASGHYATVAGGAYNTAEVVYASVGGGFSNNVSGSQATIAGGGSNFANNYYATVSGGGYNTASGYSATVAGGYADTAAGDYSIAAGQLVRITSAANNTFAFGNNFTTSTPNAVVFHNTANPIKVGVGTPNPDASLHVVGNIKMIDGNQAIGKVIVSDANGLGTWQTAPGGPPSGPAGGDLTSTYPNPTIANDAVNSTKIQDGQVQTADIADTNVTMPKINQSGATTGQVIKWTGSSWSPQDDEGAGGPFLALAGGIMTGPITNTGNPSITMGKGNFGSGNSNAGTNSFVAGENNIASGAKAAVCGGSSNTASGLCATVGGGSSNTASGQATTVGGGCLNNAINTCAVIGGGWSNTANGYNATVGGGEYNTAKGWWATVGGGSNNYAIYEATYSTIGGGRQNTASNEYATVSGGFGDTAIGQYSTIGGGYRNNASSNYTSVSGGYGNAASGQYATVGGGFADTASGPFATISGGDNNTASGDRTTVSGGINNNASGQYATVGGGHSNTASGNYSTVAGGGYNAATTWDATVCGGVANHATSWYATVAGGYGNTASGEHAMAAGGYNNLAEGKQSFTANNSSYVPSAYSNSAAFNGTQATASGQLRCGTLAKTGGTFTIDHPVNPNNKILNHYFVESPDMSNIYSGSAVLDASGRAEVSLPDYFDALNQNPRIQLTGVGSPEVYIAEDIQGNRFKIGGKPGCKVYWQVTGDRKDPSAQAIRYMMPVEQPKTGALAGSMLDDDFLVGCMEQLEEMGKAGEFSFRTAKARQRYEEMKRLLLESERTKIESKPVKD